MRQSKLSSSPKTDTALQIDSERENPPAIQACLSSPLFSVVHARLRAQQIFVLSILPVQPDLWHATCWC